MLGDTKGGPGDIHIAKYQKEDWEKFWPFH